MFWFHFSAVRETGNQKEATVYSGIKRMCFMGVSKFPGNQVSLREKHCSRTHLTTWALKMSLPFGDGVKPEKKKMRSYNTASS